MKVLIVCRRKQGKVAPFITDQVAALNKIGVETDFFYLEHKGINGYLCSLKKYYNKIRTYKPDLVHAHYGLSGLFANFQRKVPVVTTYHGSDINESKSFFFSKLSIKLSAYNIFVSDVLKSKADANKNSSVIPCGVDLNIFKPIDKLAARKILGYNDEEKLILFSSSFDIKVKNYPLAKSIVEKIHGAKLIELKGYSRKQVCLLMNSCDAVLMTSFKEGSPQFIKEAMACNSPIVSVDVGDVKEIIENTNSCSVCSNKVNELALKLDAIILNGERTNGRLRLLTLNLDNNKIAEKIIDIYNNLKVNV